MVVVAPQVHPSIRSLASEGALELLERAVVPSDLDNAWLVVAATGLVDVDDSVAADARARGALVNRADRAELGDLAFPAVVARGPLRVAVSTGSDAPAVARMVAEALDAGLDELIGLDASGVAELVGLVAEVRDQHRGVPLDWRSALDGSILDLIRQGRRAEAKERLLACLSSS